MKPKADAAPDVGEAYKQARSTFVDLSRCLARSPAGVVKLPVLDEAARLHAFSDGRKSLNVHLAGVIDLDALDQGFHALLQRGGDVRLKPHCSIVLYTYLVPKRKLYFAFADDRSRLLKIALG